MAHLDQRIASVTSRVAIIGGGWAGLACAVTLVSRGIGVTVFEAARALGGRARRVEMGGHALDNGQHLLLGAYSETLRCMRLVGADPETLLARFPLELRIVPHFRLRSPRLPAPLHTAAALLGARGLTWRERLAATKFMHVLRRARYRVTPDVTVAALLDRHGQTGALRTCLWEPLCIAALNTPIALASAEVFVNVLRDSFAATREASDLLLPRVDLGEVFPLPAVDWLRRQGADIRLGTPVRRLARTAAGFTLDTDSAPYSHVVIAVPPQHVHPLLESFASLAPLRAQIEALRFEPIYTCYLQYERARLPFAMMGLRVGMVQWVIDRGALGGPANVLAAIVSASGAHEALPLAEFTAQCDAELRSAFGELGWLRWSKTIAERRATFRCTPALSRPPNASAVPGLLLAGDYTASAYPATLEAAVRSGCAAAALISSVF